MIYGDDWLMLKRATKEQRGGKKKKRSDSFENEPKVVQLQFDYHGAPTPTTTSTNNSSFYGGR